MAQLVVQPPSRIGKNQLMDPPTVVSNAASDYNQTWFAQIVLLSSSGASAQQYLRVDSPTVHGVLVTEPSDFGYSASAYYYGFPNMSITATGTYYFQINIYAMASSGATAVGCVHTVTSSLFNVVDGAVQSALPQATGQLLERLRSNGVSV